MPIGIPIFARSEIDVPDLKVICVGMFRTAEKGSSNVLSHNASILWAERVDIYAIDGDNPVIVMMHAATLALAADSNAD